MLKAHLPSMLESVDLGPRPGIESTPTVVDVYFFLLLYLWLPLLWLDAALVVKPANGRDTPPPFSLFHEARMVL